MSEPSLIGLPCRILSAASGDEVVVELATDIAEPHIGIIPIHYLRDMAGNPFDSANLRSVSGLQGLTAARQLPTEEAEPRLAALPDGAVVSLRAGAVVRRFPGNRRLAS